MRIITNKNNPIFKHHKRKNINESIHIKHMQNGEDPFFDKIGLGKVPVSQKGYFLLVY